MLSLVPKPRSDISELAAKVRELGLSSVCYLIISQISARITAKSGPPVVVRSVGDFVALHNTDVFRGLSVGFVSGCCEGDYPLVEIAVEQREGLITPMAVPQFSIVAGSRVL